MTNWNV